MVRIAVYVNEEGMVATIKEKGSVRVYEKNDTTWVMENEIPCSIDFETGILNVRNGITSMLQSITDCKIFAALEISGQLYYLLESYGYSSYEIDGEPEQYLESILHTETEEINRAMMEQEVRTPIIKPEPTGQSGVYTINLRKAMAMDLTISSKKILKPLLQEGRFDVLEVICDHVPRWFETDLKASGFDIVITNLCANEYKVVITKNL